MRKRLALSALIVFGCGGSVPPSSVATPKITIDETRDARVYVSKARDGLSVTVVPIVSSDNSNYLLQVRGGNSEVDGMVLAAQTKGDGYRGYATTLHGEEFWLLAEQEDRRSTQLKRFITLPEDVRKKFPVSLSEPKSAAVNKKDVLKTHFAQRSDGTLEKLQGWNGEERKARNDAKLAKIAEDASKQCGKKINAVIDWSSVDDEKLKTLSIYGYCEEGVDIFERLCKRFPDMSSQLGEVTELTCSFQPSQAGLKKQGAGYLWEPVESNAREKAWSTAVPLFGYDKLVAKGKNGLTVLVDTGVEPEDVFAGNGNELRKQRRLDRNNLFGGTVTAGLAHRGTTWSLRCGSKDQELKELSRKEKDAFLKKATLKESSFHREPLYLARDSKGTYYFVDGLIKNKGGKDYRVYIGRKGAAKLTALKDIVDDSEGLIFETKKGDLRLLVDKVDGRISDEAAWVNGNKRKPLKVLPIAENGRLIFEELGVYDGVDWGTICDI